MTDVSYTHCCQKDEINWNWNWSLILLNLITWSIFGEQYRSLSSSLCSFVYSPVTSSLLGPTILLSTLFSNTLSLHSSLNVSDQVSHPYKTATWKTKDSAQNDRKHSLTAIYSYFLPEQNLDLLRLFQNISTVPPFQRKYYQSSIVTLTCILISRHDHLLSFISISIQSSHLTSNYWSFCVFTIVCMLPPIILTSSAQTKSWCVPFNFKPSWFTWTLLMAYSTAKSSHNTN